MTHIVRNIRHNESVGFVGSAPKPRAVSGSAKLAAMMARFRAVARDARAASVESENTDEVRSRMARVSARVQAMRDAAQAASPFFTSATSGYVRDADGEQRPAGGAVEHPQPAVGFLTERAGPLSPGNRYTSGGSIAGKTGIGRMISRGYADG